MNQKNETKTTKKAATGAPKTASVTGTPASKARVSATGAVETTPKTAGTPKASATKSAASSTSKTAAKSSKTAAKSAPKASAKASASKKTAPKPSGSKTPAAKKDNARPSNAAEIKANAVEANGIDELDEIIPLVNDKGETVNFYHIATIDYEKEWYVFFQPAQKMDDINEDEVVVFKLDSDEEDNDVFLPIESEELLKKVYAEYVKVMEENGGGDDTCGDSCDGCKGCG